MDVQDLDTPAVYVDLDVLGKNLRGMQEKCRQWGVGLRPHTKTHKMPEVARMQLDTGAIGITVAKVGEAEILPGDDVLIAYPLMPAKIPRVRELAKTRRPIISIDSVESAKALSGIRTLVEVEVGVGRCGVQTPEQLVEVAKACTNFEGLFYWPEWLDEAGFKKAEKRIQEYIGALKEAGLEVKIVSGGSTPGASKTPLVPQTTEIRPGTYVFNDANCVAAAKTCTIEECALRVLVTVVSDRVPGQCVVDGGSKTFSSDPTKGEGTYGIFPGRSWTMTKMNEEHGYVKIESSAKVGEKVWVIPSHVCTCVNMHDEIHYGRNDRVEGTWKVAARGKVR